MLKDIRTHLCGALVGIIVWGINVNSRLNLQEHINVQQETKIEKTQDSNEKLSVVIKSLEIAIAKLTTAMEK